MTRRCARCDDARWVCENHPDRLGKESPPASAAAPGCPARPVTRRKVTIPEMPEDFVEDVFLPRPIPRATFIGERIGEPPARTAEHFIKCERCGGWIDKRDLGAVLDLEAPLPHPTGDKPQ
jgi:hypothetical protein